MKAVVGGEDLINGLMYLSKNCPNGYYEDKTGKRDVLIVFSPEMVNAILVKEEKSISRGLVFLKMRNFFGNATIVADNPDHIKNKRIIQKDFHKNNFNKYIEIINRLCLESFEYLEKEESSLMKVSDKLSFDCVSECFAGKRVPERYISVYHDMSDKVANLPHIIFSDEEKDNFKTLKSFVTDLVFNKNSENDLIRHMIDSDMSKEQVIDEAMAILGAGFETTSALIVWSLLKIKENPKILQRIVDETPLWVKENRLPIFDEVFNSETLVNVVKETLRTNPPGYFTTRTAAKDIKISGIKIKSGTNIFISQYVSHRNEKYFKDADIWNPDRWLNNFEKDLPRGAYFPFGMGSKKCVGEHFSKMLAIMFMSMFIYKYEYNFVDEQPKPKYLVSMIPDGLVNVIVKSNIR